MALVLIASLLLAVYTLYGVVYRLYLGPLAHIPGPKLAALTRLYEAYYDLYLGGQYAFKIRELHQQYGPIIRISPYELHVSDPSFYDTLYASSASGNKRDRYPWFTRSFGMDTSTFATPGHDLHKLRRAALLPYFSMGSVRRLQTIIQERVNLLLERLKEFRDTEKVLEVSNAYSALTNDVVMMYCFARCDKRLEAEDFEPSYRHASFFGSTAGNYLKHAPWINQLVQALPLWLVELAHSSMAAFVKQRREVLKQINDITSGTNKSHESVGHKTIFHSILHSKLPSDEKADTRLTDEALVLTIAGTLTVAGVLEVVNFWLLRQPETLRKLKDELKSAIPDKEQIGKTPLPILEKMPYLNAVINEGLRLSYGVSTRMARSDPEKDIIYVQKEEHKTWLIPRGTPVGMSNVQMHHDENLFPESAKFDPERWLDGKGRGSEKYLNAFSGGSRQCLGINLAHVEFYLSISAIWRQWGSKEVRGEDDVGIFELWETDEGHVEIGGDWFLMVPKKGARGIMLKAYE